MKRNKVFLIIFLIVCLAAVSVYLVTSRIFSVNNGKPIQISILQYTDANERWVSFNAGAAQAASELNIQINTIGASGDQTSQEQIFLLNREIEVGAEGLLIAVDNEKEMMNQLKLAAEKIPLLTVESGAEDLPYIGIDHESIGVSLAECLVNQEGRIVLALRNPERGSVRRRFAAFMARAEELDLDIFVFEESKEIIRSGNYEQVLAEKIAVSHATALVAMENSTLENCIDIVQSIGFKLDLYGIGNSEKIIHAVDFGYVKEILYPNEYSIGYLSVMRLAASMGRALEPAETEIDYRKITRENMYESENQQLIFPIIQ